MKANAHINRDSIWVNGQKYKLESLPENLKNEETCEQVTEDCHLFFGKSSGFSNFFTRENLIITKEQSYSSTEQFFQSEKAKFFGDKEAYSKILATDNPRLQKQIKVKGFNNNHWQEMSFNIMKEGLSYKFNQNSDLKQKLLKTKSKTLAEASPKDCLWGTGCPLYSPQSTNKSQWGKNLMGVALMEIRQEINH